MKLLAFCACLILYSTQILGQDANIYHNTGKSPNEIIENNFGNGASIIFNDFIKAFKYLIARDERDAVASLIQYPFIIQNKHGKVIKFRSKHDLLDKYHVVFDKSTVDLLLSTNKDDWRVDQLGVGIGVDKIYFQCRSNTNGLYWRMVTINKW